MSSEPLISSAEDSPASLFPMPAGVKPKKTIAGSGLNTPVFLASYDPDSCSWRTSQGSLTSMAEVPLAKFSGTWPRSGMTLNGTAYRLLPSVPRTSVTESSSSLNTKRTHHVPTPTASDYIQRKPTRQDKAAKFNPETNKSVSLDRWVKLYPTATANDVKGAGYQKGDGDDRYLTLVGAARESSGRPHDLSASGFLNPTWDEWLMGFPLNWTNTESDPSEMLSFPKSQSGSVGD